MMYARVNLCGLQTKDVFFWSSPKIQPPCQINADAMQKREIYIDTGPQAPGCVRTLVTRSCLGGIREIVIGDRTLLTSTLEVGKCRSGYSQGLNLAEILQDGVHHLEGLVDFLGHVSRG